jgi:hypothetical protein
MYGYPIDRLAASISHVVRIAKPLGLDWPLATHCLTARGIWGRIHFPVMAVLLRVVRSTHTRRASWLGAIRNDARGHESHGRADYRHRRRSRQRVHDGATLRREPTIRWAGGPRRITMCGRALADVGGAGRHPCCHSSGTVSRDVTYATSSSWLSRPRTPTSHPFCRPHSRTTAGVIPSGR